VVRDAIRDEPRRAQRRSGAVDVDVPDERVDERHVGLSPKSESAWKQAARGG
jgi:hypothetical protein